MSVALTGLPDDVGERRRRRRRPARRHAAAAPGHPGRPGRASTAATDAAATLLTAELADPTGYGRVVRGQDDAVARVVEQADATDEELAIDEVNTSIYCFRRSVLAPALRRLSPANAQGEYYLTDVVGVLYDAGYPVRVGGGRRPHGGGRGQRPGPAGRGRGRAARPDQRALDAPRRDHVGPRADLRRRRRASWRRTCRCCPGSSCRGRCVVGAGAEIGPDAHLVDTAVGAGATVAASVCRRSAIGADARVGPVRRARPGDRGAGRRGGRAGRGASGGGRGRREPHRRATPTTGRSSVVGMEFTPRRRLELVSGRSHPALAQDIAAHLGVELGEANLPRVRQRRDPLPLRRPPSGAATSSSSRPTAAR